MENFLIFDLAIIAFIFLSAALSFSRGFSQEVLSLISWVSAFFISFVFSKYLVSYIDQIVGNLFVSKIISYIFLFIISLFFLSFLTNKFAYSVKRSSVGMIDRSLGFVFGTIRGYILLSLSLFILDSFYSEKMPKWLDNSKMNYLLMFGSTKIISVFDNDNYSVKLIEEKINKKSEKLFEKSIDSHLRRERNSNFSKEGYEKKERDNLDFLIESTNDD